MHGKKLFFVITKFTENISPSKASKSNQIIEKKLTHLRKQALTKIRKRILAKNCQMLENNISASQRSKSASLQLAAFCVLIFDSFLPVFVF